MHFKEMWFLQKIFSLIPRADGLTTDKAIVFRGSYNIFVTVSASE